MKLPDPDYEPEYYRGLPVKRALAWVIDTVIVLALCFVAMVLTAMLAVLILPLLFLSVSMAYRWVTLNNYGATYGMMVAGIKLRHLDGRRAESTACAIHAGVFSLVQMFFLPQIFSIALILTTPYRQSLADMVVQTTMLNRYDVE